MFRLSLSAHAVRNEGGADADGRQAQIGLEDNPVRRVHNTTMLVDDSNNRTKQGLIYVVGELALMRMNEPHWLTHSQQSLLHLIIVLCIA